MMAVPQRVASPAKGAVSIQSKASRPAESKMDKRFAASIERALGLFDIQEWADYISFLGRLLKVSIQSQENPTACVEGN